MYYILIFITFFSINILFAKGTLANVVIENSAVASFSLANKVYTIESSRDSFLIDRVVDVKLSWQDNKAIEVGAGEKNRVLEFILTNLGNSTDDITISYEKNTSSEFALENLQIFADTNHNQLFDLNDTIVDKITLNADENILLFLKGDIPDDVAIKEKSIYILKASSTAKETKEKDNKESVDVVLRNKEAEALGEFFVRDYWLESYKKSYLFSEDNQTHTGTQIRYEIVLKIGGNSKDKEIANIKVEDKIPQFTKYLEGSLKLNENNLTDANDSDEGAFLGDAVVAYIETIKGNEEKKITFDVVVE